MIITEGLINYFDLETISGVWKRLATLGQIFPRAWYLTDLFPEVPSPYLRPLARVSQKVMSLATGARVNLHFSDDRSIAEGIARCGFSHVLVHTPEQFSELLPTLGNRPSYTRVVEARIR